MKVNPTVKRETVYVAAVTLLLSALLQAVFLIAGWWDYTVLLGNLLGGGIAVLNFLLLGLTVQTAVNKEDKDAATFMKGSQALRSVMLLVAAVLGAVVPVFHLFATLIPLFFPTLAVRLRPLLDKRTGNGEK